MLLIIFWKGVALPVGSVPYRFRCNLFANSLRKKQVDDNKKYFHSIGLITVKTIQLAQSVPVLMFLLFSEFFYAEGEVVLINVTEPGNPYTYN